MKQILYTLRIRESVDLEEIKIALETLLYVPDIRLKPLIISKLCAYLDLKFSDPTHKIKVFIAYGGLEACGFVITQIHPTYTSYSRKCGTFGWLIAEEYDVCQELINNCEKFLKENKIRKIRGNINFPKHLGGIGFQIIGFEAPMMCGVAFNNPESQIQTNLEKLGYHNNAEYSCVHVTDSSWKQGQKNLDKNIKISYLTIEQIIDRKQEIREMIQGSFQVLLPDSSGGDTGFN